MSATPRTDALLLEINEGRVYETVGPVTELACTLERELAEAHRVISDVTRERDELRRDAIFNFRWLESAAKSYADKLLPEPPK